MHSIVRGQVRQSVRNALQCNQDNVWMMMMTRSLNTKTPTPSNQQQQRVNRNPSSTSQSPRGSTSRPVVAASAPATTTRTKYRPSWLRMMENKKRMIDMKHDESEALRQTIQQSSSVTEMKEKLRGPQHVEMMKKVNDLVELIGAQQQQLSSDPDYIAQGLTQSPSTATPAVKIVVDALTEYKNAYEKGLNIVTNIELELIQIELVETVRQAIDAIVAAQAKQLLDDPESKLDEAARKTLGVFCGAVKAKNLMKDGADQEDGGLDEKLAKSSIQTLVQSQMDRREQESRKSQPAADEQAKQKEGTDDAFKSMGANARTKYFKAIDIIASTRKETLDIVDRALLRSKADPSQTIKRARVVSDLLELYSGPVQNITSSKDFVDFSEFVDTEGVTKRKVFASPIPDLYAKPNQLSDAEMAQQYVEHVVDKVFEKTMATPGKDGASMAKAVGAEDPELLERVDPFNIRMPLGVRRDTLNQPKPVKPAVFIHSSNEIHFTNTWLLSRFLSRAGKILPRRETGLPAKLQRKVAKTIKRARQMGLLSYTERSVPFIDMNIPGQTRPNTLAELRRGGARS